MDNVQAGQMVGPYRILHQIGQGGMATVYKAYHAAMDRYVAVKILPRQLAESPEFSGRFRQEARVIARLEHAHILPVHDYGESDGFTYLVMRFLDAGTLRDRLRTARLSLIDVDRLFTQLADALDYAHAQGVIHRDLKPSNVLLDARDNVFLTDFGIAKLLESDVQYTGTGALIGTPAYMSPEQAQGRAVDQRSDIYSLGIILYEMLTGRVPFDADTPLAIILKHLNEPLPLPSSLRPDLPPAVEAVLLRALAKNPGDRFASTAQFVAAWKAALQTLGAPTMAGEAPAAPDLTELGPSVAAPPPAPPPPPVPRPVPAARPSSPPPVAAGAAPARPAVRPAPPARPSAAGKAASLLTPFGLVAAIGLLSCAALVCGYFVYNELANQPAGTATAPAATETAGAEPTTEATAESLPTLALTPFSPLTTPEPDAAAPGHPWRSWTAANTVVTLAYANDILVTGGPGGLTSWNSRGQSTGRVTTANGLPGAYVNALLIEDNGNQIWIGTDDGLLQYLDNKVHLYDGDSGLDSSHVGALLPIDNGLLVGTLYSGKDGGGLQFFKDGKWQAADGFPSGNPDEHPDKLGNSVSALAKDADGAVWVGTDNGLGRFDGQTWTRYTDSDGLPDNAIRALGVVDGQMWVGTDAGVAQFDGQAFTPVGDLGISPVYGILTTSDGTVWITGGGGAARRSPGSSDWKLFDSRQMPSYTLYTALEASDGIIFIGSDDGVVRVKGASVSVWSVPNVPAHVGFSHILPDAGTDSLWFVEEYGSSLDSFDLAQQSWSPGPSLPCQDCVPLTWDADGRLWAGGGDGLWIIAGQEVQHLTTEDSLPSNQVAAVAFDKDGQAWIGTDAGVAVYDGQSVTKVYTTDDGLDDDNAQKIMAASDGSLWVATEKYLSHFTANGRWEQYGLHTPFSSDVRVTDLAEDSGGAIWATTDGDGLYRYSDRKWQHFNADDTDVGVPVDNLNCVTVAPDGSLWFGGSYSGAVHYDGERWRAFDVSDGLIHSNVNDILIQDSGDIWFATSGGVSRYRP